MDRVNEEPIADARGSDGYAAERMLLFFGRLDEAHGVDLALRALPALAGLDPPCRLVLAGEGPLRDTLSSYARYLRVDDAVTLVVQPEGGVLEGLVPAADLVLLPARSAVPAAPVLAAWAAGKPVVVSHEAVGGLVEHDVDAVCVYPSEDSIAAAVRRVLGDAGLRARLVENGRRKLAGVAPSAITPERPVARGRRGADNEAP